MRTKYRLDELMDIATVAEQLSQPVANIRMRAINNKIGFHVGKLGRIYTPDDVETLRALIEAQSGPKPKTLKLKAQVLKLKDAGLNHRQIAEQLGVHPSYIPKLLILKKVN